MMLLAWQQEEHLASKSHAQSLQKCSVLGTLLTWSNSVKTEKKAAAAVVAVPVYCKLELSN